MPDTFLQHLNQALTTHSLVTPGERLLVAVSGGADSVALLTGLHRLAPGLSLRLTVAHLDHRIRGKAAVADAAFVQQFCKDLGVFCVTGRSDVPRRARRKGISPEMAAREARYAFLARTARKVEADAIVTAHTADDRAETVLLKLCRGAGPAGLAGISRRSEACPAPCSPTARSGARVGGPAFAKASAGKRVSGVRILRPMLEIWRADIEAFLKAEGVDWREDETNRNTDYLRNRVRHEILPLLERRLNPAIKPTLNRTAEIVGEEDRYLEAQARERLGDCVDEVGACHVTAIPLALRRRVLRLWLVQSGFPVELLTFDLAERIERLLLSKRGTTTLDSGGGWVLKRRYGRLSLDRRAVTAPEPFRIALRVPGETLLPEQGLSIVIAAAPGIEKPRGAVCGELPARASLGRKAVGRRRLYARSWKPGDRMRPFGMRGSRKLQDIFVDAKVPADRRLDIPVFECGGEIVWLPGYRVARGWEVKDATAPALQLSVTRT